MNEESVFSGFWKSCFAVLLFFVGMLLCVMTFGRASAIPQQHLLGEDAYEMRMETIIPVAPPIYTEYTDLAHLFSFGQPNLIVRCTAEKRGDATVYDPFNAYSDFVYTYKGSNLKDAMKRQGLNTDLIIVKDSHGDDDAAIRANAEAYITTPYEMRIDEVYLGDCEKKGDTFTFYAPYGIFGEYAVRYEQFPFFREGESYVMFFSIVDVAGCGRWYDLSSPETVLRVVDERTYETLTPLSDDLFDECGWVMQNLEDRIQELYQAQPYDLSVFQMEPYGNYIIE